MIAQDKGELLSLRSAVETLQTEVARLREALQDAQLRLDRLQRLQGMEHYRFPRTVELFGQTIDLENRALWERMDREFLTLVNDIPQVLLWMKRGNRYFPFIEAQIRARGLPEDLKYVAIVESGLRPEAKSHAGAVGLWQFIPGTGSRYQLRATSWVDERQDPMRSTEAALSYLQDLHRILGDWILAVAAYNVGENRILSEMQRQGVSSYFDLVLPSETERYVFRIAAAKVILSNPPVYGFDLAAEELYASPLAERLKVSVDRGELDLIGLARSGGMTYRALRALNPHLRESVLPQGVFEIYVPAEKAKEFASLVEGRRALMARSEGKASVPAASQPSQARESQARKTTHNVRAGETLWDIAQKYKVNVKSIQEWNQLGGSSQIRAGQQLIIFR